MVYRTALMLKGTPFHTLPILTILALFTPACSTPQKTTSGHAPESAQEVAKKFYQKLAENPDAIWKSDLTPKTKAALKDYQSHRVVGVRIGERGVEKMEYGESVRHFDLRGQSAQSIEQDLTALHCKKKLDLLKNPDTKLPLEDKTGRAIPMWVFLCPDGGVVRVKVQGDPTSKFLPQPHAVKALRYPYNGPFESFDDEVAKVDNTGHIIPKWPKDLNTFSQDPAEQKKWVDAWAQDAHTDLAK